MQAGQGSGGRAVALAAASERQEQGRVGAVTPAAPQLSCGGKRKSAGEKDGEKAENNEGTFELEGTG